MSRIAGPRDNARAGTFTKTSKHEAVDRSTFCAIDEAGSAVGSFIDEVCDSRRLHSALHYQVPSNP